MTKPKNLVPLLRAEHEHIKTLFGTLSRASAHRRPEAFCELTNELVRHEVAEETIVFPVARQQVGNGERLVDARIKEQSEAEELLAQIERGGTEGQRFEELVAKLEQAVLLHAETEEQLVFEPLEAALDPDRSKDLAKLYEAAKAIAPTHPHPHLPDTPPGNLVAGPVAAILDRARDAMHKVVR